MGTPPAGAPEELRHHFGERLRRLRGDRPQREIATALGMPTTTYASLERQADIPRGETLRRLTDHFHVTVSYFYPPVPAKSSERAKAWLSTLRQSFDNQTKRVATHLDERLDDDTRSEMAERVRKIAETEDR